MKTTTMAVSMPAMEWRLLLALAATGDTKKAVNEVMKTYTHGADSGQVTYIADQLKSELDEEGRRMLGSATNVEVVR